MSIQFYFWIFQKHFLIAERNGWPWRRECTEWCSKIQFLHLLLLHYWLLLRIFLNNPSNCTLFHFLIADYGMYRFHLYGISYLCHSFEVSRTVCKRSSTWDQNHSSVWSIRSYFCTFAEHYLISFLHFIRF